MFYSIKINCSVVSQNKVKWNQLQLSWWCQGVTVKNGLYWFFFVWFNLGSEQQLAAPPLSSRVLQQRVFLIVKDLITRSFRSARRSTWHFWNKGYIAVEPGHGSIQKCHTYPIISNLDAFNSVAFLLSELNWISFVCITYTWNPVFFKDSV